MSKALQNSQVPNLIPSFTGFKNRIINGRFNVWQRGLQFQQNKVVTADRWIVYDSKNGSDKAALVTNESGLTITLNDDYTADTDYINLMQRIERWFLPYSTEDSVLSALINPNRDIKISVFVSLTTKGTEVDGEYIYYKEFYLKANTDNKIVLKIPRVDKQYEDGVSAIDEGGRVNFIISEARSKFIGGKAENWDNTDKWCDSALTPSSGLKVSFKYVQLEPGTEASAPEAIPFDVELNRCMRYFEKISTAVLKADFDDDTFGIVYFKQVKRNHPIIGFKSPETGARGKMAYWTNDTQAFADVDVYVVSMNEINFIDTRQCVLIGNKAYIPRDSEGNFATNDAMGYTIVYIDSEIYNETDVNTVTTHF